MKDKDLLRVMSEIKDEYILEAAPDEVPASPKRVPIWRRPGFRIASGAAAACFIALIGLGTWQLTQKSSRQEQPEMTMEEYMDNGAAKEAAGGAAQMEEAAEAPAAAEQMDQAAKASADGSKDMAMESVAEYETETETETESET